MKDYCTQNEGECDTCSLAKNQRDCMNNPTISNEEGAQPVIETIQTPDSSIGYYRLIDSGKAYVKELSEQVLAGKMTQLMWGKLVQALIKDTAFMASCLGCSDDAILKAVEIIEAEARIFFDKFNQELQTGVQPMTDMDPHKSELYMDTDYGPYMDALRISKKEAGFDEERNVLRDHVDHCDDCMQWTLEDWVPLGTFPLPGHRECKKKCGCQLEFRRSTDVVE